MKFAVYFLVALTIRNCYTIIQIKKCAERIEELLIEMSTIYREAPNSTIPADSHAKASYPNKAPQMGHKTGCWVWTPDLTLPHHLLIPGTPIPVAAKDKDARDWGS